MLNTVEAVMNEYGEIRLREPVRVPSPRRVLVTILDEPPVEAQAAEAPAQTTKAGQLLASMEQQKPGVPAQTTKAGRLLALMEQQMPEVPTQTTKAGRLLALLDKLERLPPSNRTTEEMNADIQAERDACDEFLTNDGRLNTVARIKAVNILEP